MAEQVEFVADAEPWCRYTLEDGTIIKIRVMLVKAFRNGLLENGNINYQLQCQQVLDATPSEMAMTAAREEQARKEKAK